MRSTYLWAMDVLENPQFYSEKDLQEAVESLWSVLFHDSVQLGRESTGMPKTWQPDIVAYDRKESVWLVVELKSKPPSGSREQALRQVARYARQMLDTFPEYRLRPVLIGPWDKGYLWRTIDVDGMNITQINVISLGNQVHALFENLVRWCLDVPFPGLQAKAIVDEWIRTLPISVAQVEETDEDEQENQPYDPPEEECFEDDCIENTQVK